MDATVTETFSLKKVIPTVLTVALGMILVMMDTTIMNIALPTLQQQFGTNLSTAQWSITAYTFALSAITPIAGWLSDRITSKRAFAIAIVAFTVISYLCSLSNSMTMLITLRILQGIAGGVIGPVGMALSWQVIPQEQRGSLMGLLGLPMVVAPIAGPLLCGWLLQTFTWHSIFLINVPIGIVAFLMVLKYIPKIAVAHQESLDWRGMLLAPLGFLSLLYGIHRLGTTPLTNLSTMTFIIIGILLIVIFFFNELHQDSPLMAVSAFKSGKFTRGISVSWLNQIVLFGTTLLVPLFLQTAKGFTALHAAAIVAPQALASLVGMIIGGRLFDRWGIRAAAIPGIGLMLIAIYSLTGLTATTTTLRLVVIIIILGLGQGMTMMQVSTYNLSVAPKKAVSRVTPMINSAMQIVNSMAVVLLTNVLASNLKGIDRDQIISAYGHTFLVPLGFLIVSWLLTWTLTSPKKLADLEV